MYICENISSWGCILKERLVTFSFRLGLVTKHKWISSITNPSLNRKVTINVLQRSARLQVLSSIDIFICTCLYLKLRSQDMLGCLHRCCLVYIKNTNIARKEFNADSFLRQTLFSKTCRDYCAGQSMLRYNEQLKRIAHEDLMGLTTTSRYLLANPSTRLGK